MGPEHADHLSGSGYWEGLGFWRPQKRLPEMMELYACLIQGAVEPAHSMRWALRCGDGWRFARSSGGGGLRMPVAEDFYGLIA